MATGLLGDSWDDPRTSMMLALASGLLGGRGNLAQNLGAGLQAAIPAYQGASKLADARELHKAQMEKYRADAKRAEMLAAKGVDPHLPSAIQVYEYWNKLTPDARRDMLDTMRGGNYAVKEIGGVPSVVAPRDVYQGQGGTAPLSNLQQEIGAAASKAGAVESARTSAELRTKTATQAQVDLPSAEVDASNVIGLAESLKKHPGLRFSVGIPGVIPFSIPNTPQADFMARYNQLKGKQFLEAYNTLKGGGQITEIEGKKAGDAIARMDRMQSPEDFQKALSDFQDAVRSGFSKLSARAGQQGSPASAPPKKRLVYDPATGDFK